MYRVAAVRPLEGYRLAVDFEDGLRGEIDLGDRLSGPVFEPLRDPAAFRAVSIDSRGPAASRALATYRLLVSRPPP